MVCISIQGFLLKTSMSFFIFCCCFRHFYSALFFRNKYKSFLLGFFLKKQKSEKKTENKARQKFYQEQTAE
jgi:hypothetical protein